MDIQERALQLSLAINATLRPKMHVWKHTEEHTNTWHPKKYQVKF